MIMKSFYSFFISLSVTFFLIPIMRKIAFLIGAIDLPDGKVKFHKNPTPYLGGIAIYVGFIVALCCIVPFRGDATIFFFIGGTFLLLLGLFDDLVVIKPALKLLGQVIAVAFFLKAGFYLKPQFFENIWHSTVSVLWLLTLINAFNLVDVMDGLSTTIAISITLFFTALAFLFKLPILFFVLCSLLGALVAFLWYNRPDATIYMGDCGSLFIGGLLGVVSFFFNLSECCSCGHLPLIIVFAVPLLEVSTLIIIRTYKKIPFYQGSPHHFSMYLLRKGWTKQQILIFVATFSCVLFCGAICTVCNLISVTTLFVFGIVAILFWNYIIFSPYLGVDTRS